MPPTQSGCIFPQAMVSAKGALFELKKAVRGMFFERLRCVASYVGTPEMAVGFKARTRTPALTLPLAKDTVLPEPLPAAPRRESKVWADSVCSYLASCPGELLSGPCVSLDFLPNVSGSPGEDKTKRK